MSLWVGVRGLEQRARYGSPRRGASTGVYAQGHMHRGICTGAYARGHMHGGVYTGVHALHTLRRMSRCSMQMKM